MLLRRERRHPGPGGERHCGNAPSGRPAWPVAGAKKRKKII